MTLKALLAVGALFFFSWAAAQDKPAAQSNRDRNEAPANQQEQTPPSRREDQAPSAGPSSSAQKGPYGEQPPAVSPAGSSPERTAEPKEGGKDKHDAPTGEKTNL